MRKIIAIDKAHLELLISEEIELNGNQCDLNHIDVSKIKNMNNLFRGSQFNGNISNWDVSNVESMKEMFAHSKFQQALVSWTPYQLKDAHRMFFNSKAPVPYWVESKNATERKAAIYVYQLENELKVNTGVKTKKIKI